MKISFSIFDVSHKFRRVNFVKGCLARRIHISLGKGHSMLLEGCSEYGSTLNLDSKVVPSERAQITYLTPTRSAEGIVVHRHLVTKEETLASGVD